MSDKDWILIASPTQARIYTRDGELLNLVDSLGDEAGNAKASDLVSDGYGRRVESSTHHGHVSPQKDPKEHQHSLFAHRIAKRVDKGRTHGEYERLTLIAGPSFGGLLMKSFDEQVRRTVVDTVQKDYSKVPDRDLPELLDKVA